MILAADSPYELRKRHVAWKAGVVEGRCCWEAPAAAAPAAVLLPLLASCALTPSTCASLCSILASRLRSPASRPLVRLWKLPSRLWLMACMPAM